MKARALILAVPFLALTACKDNIAVQIQAICFPPDDCSFSSGSCDKQLIGNPVVDVATGTSLTLFIQVGNQVSNNADPGTGKVNTHDAHVEEAVIGGVSIPISSTWIPADGSGVVDVTIPTAGGQVALQFRGHFADGTSFLTAEFLITVNTCSGCVPACPAGKVPCPAGGELPFTCFDPTGSGTV